MPMILSGEKLAILEPTKTIFKTPSGGLCWHLKQHKNELANLQDVVFITFLLNSKHL
jgi:hypothetical protein